VGIQKIDNKMCPFLHQLAGTENKNLNNAGYFKNKILSKAHPMVPPPKKKKKKKKLIFSFHLSYLKKMQSDFTYSLTFKNYFLAMLHSLLNMHLQHHLFLCHLVTSA
jgi:hypothetical protein